MVAKRLKIIANPERTGKSRRRWPRNQSLGLKTGLCKPMVDVTINSVHLATWQPMFILLFFLFQPVLWLCVLLSVTDIRHQRQDVHDRENDSQRQYNCPWSNIQTVPILPPQPRFEVLIEVVWFTDSYARLLFSLRLSGSWWMQRRLCGRTGVIPSRPTPIFSRHPENTRSFSLSCSLIFE